MAKNPKDVAEKWAKNYSNSTGDFEKSIQELTVNPMEQAINAGEEYISGVQQAYADGRWVNGLRSVNFQAWKAKTIRLGKARMQEGAKEALPKMEKFMSQWLPHMASLKQKLASMPKGRGGNNRARLLAAFDHNSDFVYNK